MRSAHPVVCRQWFRELEPLGVASGSYGIRAHSSLHKNYLRRECLDAFNDAVRSETGQLIGVRFLGPDDDASPFERPRKKRISSRPAGADGQTAPIPTPMPSHETILPREAPTFSDSIPPDYPDALPINPDFGFETFVIGPNNELAQAAALAVSAKPGRAYNPLFIHGDVGLGKTHLLQAVCLKVKQARPDAKVVYISCDGFMAQFMGAVQDGSMSEFRHRFRDVDLLVIDDIHFLAKRDRTQEEFFHTFNALYQNNRQIILSSDTPPEEIPHLEDRLVSRFKWGLVAKVDAPGYETRIEILRAKAELRGVELNDDVVCYIAQHIDSNIRELEGAITTLQMRASVEKRRADLELAQDCLAELGAAPASDGPTIESIIAAVSDFYSVRKADLLGKRRHKSISLPRQVSMYLAREHTRHSLEEIGAHFGGRDHTTVMHAVRTVKARRGGDADFEAVVRSLEQQVRRRRPGRD
ncbi:MAG: chromosomal replication initiator protein DnaA [Phycisphaerales bacterium]